MVARTVIHVFPFLKDSRQNLKLESRTGFSKLLGMYLVEAMPIDIMPRPRDPQISFPWQPYHNVCSLHRTTGWFLPQLLISLILKELDFVDILDGP